MGVAAADISRSVARPFTVATSVAGPRHLADGSRCEDASAALVVDGRVIVAVSDGLGSVAGGGEGAAIAVGAAIDAGLNAVTASRLPDHDEIVHTMAMSARRALEQNGSDPREFACTLIALVADGTTCAVAHIGDGAVVGRNNGGLIVVSPPADCEYVNEVEHLGQDNWRAALRISIYEPVGELMAFTDGLQRAALRRTDGCFVPFDGFMHPLFDHAVSVDDLQKLQGDLVGLLGSAKLSEHSEDDKTLALAIFDDIRPLRSPDW